MSNKITFGNLTDKTAFEEWFHFTYPPGSFGSVDVMRMAFKEVAEKAFLQGMLIHANNYKDDSNAEFVVIYPNL